jgi:hypothetical protein
MPRGRAVLLTALLAAACRPADGPDCSLGGGAGAPSVCLKPQQSSAYYVAQSQLYFNTLDSSVTNPAAPDYSTLVARWEWPPWLKLTGYQSSVMVATDQVLKAEQPSTVPTRDCQAFTTQPFGRCHVSIQYSGGPCPIYEEFTFNNAGQMTFIEAWSDLPGLRPMAASDHWAEASDVQRLSTKIPGLGNSQGLINLNSTWMQQAAKGDPNIADFVSSAENFWPAWTAALEAAGPNLYRQGCGWPAG